MHEHLHDHLVECDRRMHVHLMCWEWRWLRCLSFRLTTACQPPGWRESAGVRAPTATRTEAASRSRSSPAAALPSATRATRPAPRWSTRRPRSPHLFVVLKTGNSTTFAADPPWGTWCTTLLV